jgi:hypothetical protein
MRKLLSNWSPLLNSYRKNVLIKTVKFTIYKAKIENSKDCTMSIKIKLDNLKSFCLHKTINT